MSEAATSKGEKEPKLSDLESRRERPVQLFDSDLNVVATSARRTGGYNREHIH